MNAQTIGKERKVQVVQMAIDDSGTLKKAPSQLKQLLYSFYVLFVTVLLVIFITANIQLMLGSYSTGVCGLYFTVDVNSPTCATNANAGFIGIAATIVLVTIRIVYVRNSNSPGKIVTMFLALSYTFLTAAAIVFGGIYTAGIKATCQIYSNYDCKTDVFGRTVQYKDKQGFVDGNLVLNAAIFSIWASAAMFAGFAVYEWIKVRKFN